VELHVGKKLRTRDGKSAVVYQEIAPKGFIDIHRDKIFAVSVEGKLMPYYQDGRWLAVQKEHPLDLMEE
jgi:hypothetical protein